MNQAQAIDLANVLGHIRPDWQQPGILAALRQADATYGALALHSIRIALDHTSKTPAAINASTVTPETKSGNWHQPDYSQVQARCQKTANCNLCDERGYQPSGHLCPHDGLTTEERTERTRQRSAAARAAIKTTKRYDTEEQA